MDTENQEKPSFNKKLLKRVSRNAIVELIVGEAMYYMENERPFIQEIDDHLLFFNYISYIDLHGCEWMIETGLMNDNLSYIKEDVGFLVDNTCYGYLLSFHGYNERDLACAFVNTIAGELCKEFKYSPEKKLT